MNEAANNVINNNSSSSDNTSQHHHQPIRETDLQIQSALTAVILILTQTAIVIYLWVLVITEQNVGSFLYLLVLELLFTSLVAITWYLIRQEAAREWLESANDDESTFEGGGDTTLASVILESQRQMFENGGYGRNDHSTSTNGPGVTNEAKQSWDMYEWGKCRETTDELRAVIHKSDSKTKIGGDNNEGGDYGSVRVVDNASSHLSELEGGLLLEKSFDDDDEEEPSCSICLCEYENGETVTKLPCNHIYHESCITSWTESNVRCPLCNYDLMTGFEYNDGHSLDPAYCGLVVTAEGYMPVGEVRADLLYNQP